MNTINKIFYNNKLNMVNNVKSNQLIFWDKLKSKPILVIDKYITQNLDEYILENNVLKKNRYRLQLHFM